MPRRPRRSRRQDGSFEITDLPVGTCTIEVWHDELGVHTQSVAVDGTTPTTVTLSFKR